MSSNVISSSTSSSSSRPSISTEGLLPHEIANVFASVQQQQREQACGCNLPLNVAVSSKSCPICETPIGYVRDGLVGKRPSVMFKYNKLVLSLSVIDMAAMAAQQKQQLQGASSGLWHSSVPLNSINTAQGRIASVLKLSAIKILSKGKVLYPSTTLTEEQVSQQLINLSSSASISSSTKVALLVMGTAAGRELPPRSSSSSSSSSLSSWIGTMALRLLQCAVKWSLDMLVFGIQWTQQTLRHIYATAQSLLLPSTSANSNNHAPRADG